MRLPLVFNPASRPPAVLIQPVIDALAAAVCKTVP